MHPVVKQLVALQGVDQKVASVQKKLDAIPRETTKRRAEVETLEKRERDLQTTIDTAERRNNELEEKVRGLDAAIARQEEHRDKAGNASTFTAAQHQIEYLHQDKETVQNEQIELMDVIETNQASIQEVREQLNAARERFDAYMSEANELEADLKGRRDEIAKSRGDFLTDIPEQSLVLYNEMFESTGGEAVVPIDNNHCTGCYTRLTPNDLAYLRAGTTLVTCKFCGRVLYDPIS